MPGSPINYLMRFPINKPSYLFSFLALCSSEIEIINGDGIRLAQDFFFYLKNPFRNTVLFFLLLKSTWDFIV